MRRKFLGSVLGIWIGLHCYIALRLVPDLAIGFRAEGLCWLYLIVSALVGPLPLPLAMRLSRLSDRQADLLAWAGYLAMGAFSTLVVLSLLRDIVLLACWLISLGLAQMDRWPWPSLVRWTARAVALLALTLTALGVWNARRTPQVREISIPFPHLPMALSGFTIVQLSDLHIGPTIRRGFVARVVRRVSALRADVIAITGDLIDGPLERREADLEPLAELRSRHGTFAVTGNHEYYHGADPWIAAWRRRGLTILMNEHRVLEHEGASLLMAGVTDYSAAPFGPDHASDPAMAMRVGEPVESMITAKTPMRLPPDLCVLLAHQPRSAPAALAAGFDLQLSGHTHGGQFWPWMYFVPLQQPIVAGLKRLGRLRVYVSRGTGYWGPPIRLGAPSEITRIRLVRGDS